MEKSKESEENEENEENNGMRPQAHRPERSCSS